MTFFFSKAPVQFVLGDFFLCLIDWLIYTSDHINESIHDAIVGSKRKALEYPSKNIRILVVTGEFHPQTLGDDEGCPLETPQETTTEMGFFLRFFFGLAEISQLYDWLTHGARTMKIIVEA